MTNREIAEKWTAAHRQGLLNVKDCIESAIEEAADAWNKRVPVKLEWKGGYASDSHETHYLHLGKIDVGSACRYGDENIWFDTLGGSGAQYANTIDQAKQQCEASVRKSLSELMEGSL